MKILLLGKNGQIGWELRHAKITLWFAISPLAVRRSSHVDKNFINHRL